MLTLSQLTCWYQLCLVMGWSVMCGFFGSYFELRFGSEVLAMGEGCEMYLGSMACMPAVGWWEGIVSAVWEGGEVKGKVERRMRCTCRQLGKRCLRSTSMHEAPTRTTKVCTRKCGGEEERWDVGERVTGGELDIQKARTGG
jgi:hypothetical protein